MPDGTGLNLMAERYPSRCFDVGIAEQHGVTFAAALAAGGMKPFCTMYSTFLQRGYDQLVHDVAVQRLPVRFAIDRAGLVGADGATHAGSFDIAFMANLPGIVVMAAADEAELMHMIATAHSINDAPSAFRYPRGEGVGVDLPERGEVLEIGKGRMPVRGRSRRRSVVCKRYHAHDRRRAICQTAGSRHDPKTGRRSRSIDHNRRRRHWRFWKSRGAAFGRRRRL